MDLIKKGIGSQGYWFEFQNLENSENEPRLKGRSLVSDENNTIVKKGTLHFVKKERKMSSMGDESR